MSERETFFLLQDIRDAIQNIFDFTKDLVFENYDEDLKTRHAVEHNFMIIGEAVSRLPEEFRVRNEIINWRQVKDFRNVIVHDYFGIDNTIVWNIIQHSLKDLLDKVSYLLQIV